MERKLVLYIAMSLDGYIAKQDDNIDFLSVVDNGSQEDFGYAAFLNGIDTVIWGRRTYDKVVSFGGEIPHQDKQVYVISRTKQGTDKSVFFHSDVAELVRQLKSQEGKDIYCDGGAEVVFELLKHKLFDRLIISVVPHLLGSGIRLFKDGFPEQYLTLKQSISFPSGLVQVWYEGREDRFEV